MLRDSRHQPACTLYFPATFQMPSNDCRRSSRKGSESPPMRTSVIALRGARACPAAERIRGENLSCTFDDAAQLKSLASAVASQSGFLCAAVEVVAKPCRCRRSPDVTVATTSSVRWRSTGGRGGGNPISRRRRAERTGRGDSEARRLITVGTALGAARDGLKAVPYRCLLKIRQSHENRVGRAVDHACGAP